MDEEFPVSRRRLWRCLGEDAAGRLARYFRSYGGRQFNSLGGGGDRPGAKNRFTPDDLVAVSLLNTPIPPNASLRLLQPPDPTMQRLLAKVPTNVDLHQTEFWDQIGPGLPLSRLWHGLTAIDGIGWVGAGKLLARKRPRLVPIYDTVVKQVIDPRASWWFWVWDAVHQARLLERLCELRVESDIGTEVPLLRVLDVAVWMSTQPAS